jgi:hypothetical protein
MKLNYPFADKELELINREIGGQRIQKCVKVYNNSKDERILFIPFL